MAKKDSSSGGRKYSLGRFLLDATRCFFGGGGHTVGGSIRLSELLGVVHSSFSTNRVSALAPIIR